MSAISDAQSYSAEGERLRVEMETARRARDNAIRVAHRDEGATIAQLSRTTGLTRTMLYKILDK